MWLENLKLACGSHSPLSVGRCHSKEWAKRVELSLHFTDPKTEAPAEHSVQGTKLVSSLLIQAFLFPHPGCAYQDELNNRPTSRAGILSENHKGGVEPLDVALPSAETSPDKTNKPLGLANCSGERKPRKIKDPAVTPFRAAQLAALPNPRRAPTGPLARGSQRLASNSSLLDTCRRQEWAGSTSGSRCGGGFSWTSKSKRRARVGGHGASSKLTLSAKAGLGKTGKGQRERHATGATSPDLSFITCKLEPLNPAQPASR